jgi:hypothetical protein
LAELESEFQTIMAGEIRYDASRYEDASPYSVSLAEIKTDATIWSLSDRVLVHMLAHSPWARWTRAGKQFDDRAHFRSHVPWESG